MEEINVKELFDAFWSKKIQIIIIVLIFLVAGFIYQTEFVKPMYNATTTLVLASATNQNTNSSTNTITTTDVTMNSKLVATYSNLIKSDMVLSAVAENLNNKVNEEQLKKNVVVNAVEDTELIEITVKNEDPYSAAQIANEIANVFTQKVQELYNINNVQLVAEAQVPSSPYNVSGTKNLAKFGLIGIAVAAAYVLLLNALDVTIKSAEEIEKDFKVPVLASIPKMGKDIGKNEVITQKDPKSPISEIFRTLRTNIQFTSANKDTKTLLITSTFPGEGKSWITSNIAVAFAQTGKKVVIVDADMRKGRQYNIFGLVPEPGLSNYLSQIEDNNGNAASEKLADYIQKTQIENLSLMSAGTIPPNPSELLTSERMPKLLEQLKGEFDIVIIDGTPCKLVTDSIILSSIADTNIIVTAYKSTKKDALDRVVKNIQNVNANIAGVVLNKIPISTKKYHETYYYYGEEKRKRK